MGITERKAREKERRRQIIMDTAKEIFQEKGLSSTTIEDIATRAELSTATIYLYFKNKEELYAYLNLKTVQIVQDEIEKVYNREDLNPDEKMVEFQNVFYKTFERDPLILKNIIRLQLEDGLTTLSPDLLNDINVSTKKAMALIANTYQEGVTQGILQKENGVVIADVMWATFIGLMIYEEAKRKINPPHDFLKPTLDTAFKIFLRGIQN